MKLIKLLLPVFLIVTCCSAQKPTAEFSDYKPTKILSGADRIDVYMP